MSLAWATVVVAVLLTPGAFFFAGLYAPQAVSRETLAISPLGQLAAIVCTSFFLHGLFAWCINSLLSGEFSWIDRIEFAQFFPVLHADADPTKDGLTAGSVIRDHLPVILGYFAAIDVAGAALGYLCGVLIENRVPLFRTLARHPWLCEIKPHKELVVVFALSKVHNDGQLILYEGQLQKIYVKADGCISYMTLGSAKSSILALPSRTAPASSEHPIPDGTAFIPSTISRGPDWSFQQNSVAGNNFSKGNDILFLSGSEISNFYLERRPLSGSVSDTEMLRQVRDALAQISRASATEASSDPALPGEGAGS
ncbi:hypothetical protein [Burkholderia ubonensis]|uniref:hypothetical protein n=1 Tax=Burkholderia ubonensis TaxID=101571 RepID=UPI000A8D7FDB|nr:hypothetical protein [Burkholderia ubonensis]